MCSVLLLQDNGGWAGKSTVPYWQAASLWLLTRVSSFLCRMLAWQHKRGHSIINLSMSGQFIISLVLQKVLQRCQAMYKASVTADTVAYK